MRNDHPSASRNAIQRARKLRRDSTVLERVLWGLLQAGRLRGLKFRRQHPVGPFFADFYCHNCKLVVELDGTSHDGRADADRRREAYLRKCGLSVLRISNDNVMNNLEGVAKMILRAAGPRTEPESRLTSRAGAGNDRAER
ncbi:MAG: endonuclease domain-containing protein [Deltaproteobacteria bacterium]